MKKVILLLLGLVPFIVGFLMNGWIIQNPDDVLPYKVIGITFLAFWLLVGFLTAKFSNTPLKSTSIINLPAMFILLIIMYQDIIASEFLSNAFGRATQYYFMPLLNIGASIVGTFLTVHVWSASFIAFLLMFAAYYLGAYLKEQRSIIK